MAGAVLSGPLVRDTSLQAGRRYGFALMIESLLLAVAMVLFVRESVGAEYSRRRRAAFRTRSPRATAARSCARPT